jgi:septum formation protein
MSIPIVLASGSEIRATMLRSACVPFAVCVAQIDEDTIRTAMLSKDATPRDIADALAEAKARKISAADPGALVIGCDQVLEFNGRLLSKPPTPQQALDDLRAMRGHCHQLLSAAVICQNGEPVWRHVGQVRLTMRAASDAWLKGYVTRNWDSIRHAVGAYKLEEEGVRLFAAIDGDHFNVLGMPLMECLSFLTLRGAIDG